MLTVQAHNTGDRHKHTSTQPPKPRYQYISILRSKTLDDLPVRILLTFVIGDQHNC